MNPSLIRSTCASLIAFGLLGTSRLQASDPVVVFDNINTNHFWSAVVTSSNFAAQSFTTGTDSRFTLGQVVLSIGAFGTEGLQPNVQVKLWSTEIVDGLDFPDLSAPVYTLYDWASPPAGTGVPIAGNWWTINPTSSPLLTLAAGTQYWISVGVSSNDGGSIEWNAGMAPNDLVITPSNGTWNPENPPITTGVFSQPDTYGYIMTVSDIPEPTSVALSILGVGTFALLRRYKP